MENENREDVLHDLREAIQNAEQFGLVRTENGQVVKGAIDSEDGIILTENQEK